MRFYHNHKQKVAIFIPFPVSSNLSIKLSHYQQLCRKMKKLRKKVSGNELAICVKFYIAANIE